MTKKDMEIVRGSGNVFRDFGRPNADLEQARAILAARIVKTLDEHKLTARAAEKLTGVAHTDLSRIRNAKLERFTLDRMITIFFPCPTRRGLTESSETAILAVEVDSVAPQGHKNRFPTREDRLLEG